VSDDALIEQVAWACRILADEGYEDLTLGHVSARGSDGRTIHIKRKGVALSEVTPADVLAFDVDADLASAPGNMHLEAVLHQQVYKRRDDVRCVLHGHPPYATAFGATDARFEPLTHDGVMFIHGLASYDGVPDLIVDRQQAADVAEALGQNSTVLLRNHGVLVAGSSIAWATVTGVLLERSVQIQAIASSLGPLRPIRREWLEQIHERKYQDGFELEYWEAWIRALRRKGRAFGMPEER
jgi:L-fuculose-phosphate aldolase